MGKVLSALLTVILLMGLWGCDNSDFKNIEKEDREIYLELYELYNILDKNINKNSNTQLQGKERERYIYLRDKYMADDIILNQTQEEIVEIFTDLITLQSQSTHEELKEKLEKINKIFSNLKTQ